MVTTQNFVNTQANVISVTQLSKGDVYKRLHQDYSTAPYELKFGIVTDVLNNGTDSVITALEFEVSHNDASMKMKTFGTSTELRIFACDPDEVVSHLGDIDKKAATMQQDAEKKVRDLTYFRNQLSEVEKRAARGELSAAPTDVRILEAASE